MIKETVAFGRRAKRKDDATIEAEYQQAGASCLHDVPSINCESTNINTCLY